MKTLIATIILSSLSFGQTKVPPPKIDYSKYGSLSGQMIVYQNVQRQIDVLELEKYRAFREEIRRQTPTVVTTYYVSERRSYYDRCPVSNDCVRQRNSWRSSSRKQLPRVCGPRAAFVKTCHSGRLKKLPYRRCNRVFFSINAKGRLKRSTRRRSIRLVQGTFPKCQASC